MISMINLFEKASPTLDLATSASVLFAALAYVVNEVTSKKKEKERAAEQEYSLAIDRIKSYMDKARSSLVDMSYELRISGNCRHDHICVEIDHAKEIRRAYVKILLIIENLMRELGGQVEYFLSSLRDPEREKALRPKIKAEMSKVKDIVTVCSAKIYIIIKMAPMQLVRATMEEGCPPENNHNEINELIEDINLFLFF